MATVSNPTIRKASNTFGSDPEFFVVSKRYGKIMSAHRIDRFLPVEYNDPSSYRPPSMIKRDGPAVEFNPSATTCRDDQVPFFFHGLRKMDETLEKAGLKAYTLSGDSVAELSKPSLKDAPEDVSEFGCNPDWNAYTMSEKSPTCPRGSLKRYAGGHIHIGLGAYNYGPMAISEFKNDLEYQADVAILMDCLVGFPAVGVLGPKYAENERDRRQFYGQAGSFRISSNNTFEYRVLSNTGFALSPILMSMWLGIAKFLPIMNKEDVRTMLKTFNDFVGIDKIRAAINSHDYSFVWSTYEQWVKAYPKNLHKDVPHNLAQLYDASQGNVIWDSDILFNWGVSFPDFSAQHHAYWGHENGAKGWLSKVIFPGSVSNSIEDMLAGIGFQNHGYNIDNRSSAIRRHPSEGVVNNKRSWE